MIYNALDREQIAGIPVHPVSLSQTIDAVVTNALGPSQGAYVCLSNANIAALSHESSDLRRAINGAFLSVPDGMPMVWVLRRRGHAHTEKVTGRELMPMTISAGVEKGLRHLLYGGGPGVAEAAAAELVRRVPGAMVEAAAAPPFASVDNWPMDDLRSLVEVRRPHVLWVGIGAPKQEILMARMAGELDVPVQVGVGAAFDFIAGSKREVPAALSDAGLEWLFRLATEPRRLWKRYLVGNTRFLYLLGREALR